MSTDREEREEFQSNLGFSENMFDAWNTGDDFIIPTRHPPVAKQLERTWMINHAEPLNNLISNTGAGGDSYRTSPSGEYSAQDYEAEYFKLFMREKNPLKISEYMKTKIGSDVLAETKPIWSKIAAERGLLGDYYVTVKPFASCNEAAVFFEKHCKKAKFVKKISACEGCVHNRGTVCDLTSKYLVATVPYTEKIAAAIVKELIKDRQLPREDVKKIASASTPKKKIQAALQQARASLINTSLNTQEESVYNEGYTEAKIQATQPALVRDRDKLALVLEKLIKNGVSYSKIATKLGKHTGSSVIKEMIPDIVHNISPLNTVKFADCADFLKGHVSLLIKDASCSDCAFYAGDRCSKYKVSFVKDAKDPVLHELTKKVKQAQLENKEQAVTFFAKCIDSGVSLKQLKEAFQERMEKGRFSEYMGHAVKKASKLSPFSFSGCAGNYYKPVAKVYRTADCAGCSYNEGDSCSKVARAFSNPDAQAKQNMFAPNVEQDLIRPSEIMGFQNVVKSASKHIAQGVSVDKLSDALHANGFIPSQIRQVFKEAMGQVNAVDTNLWNECAPAEEYRYAQRIKKTSACEGCVDNQHMKCARFGKPFAGRYVNTVADNQKVDDHGSWFDKNATGEKEIAQVNTVVSQRPQVTEEDLAETRKRFAANNPNVKIARQFMSANIPLRQVIANLSKQGLDSAEIKRTLQDTFSSMKSINTVALNNCQPSGLYKSAQALIKTSTCAGCMDNQQIKCARFGKSFSNAEDYVSSNEATIASLSEEDDDMEWFKHSNGKPQMQIPDMTFEI